MRIVTALTVLGLAASGHALADGDTSQPATTTERKTDGDGAKADGETKRTTTTTTQKTDGDGSKTAVETKRTTTTTTRKTDGDGVKTTMETKSKSDGAAGETTRDEKFTVEKHATPDGNTEVKRDVKTSRKGRASPSTHRTHVEQTTVRDAQGNVISEEKKVK